MCHSCGRSNSAILQAEPPPHFESVGNDNITNLDQLPYNQLYI